MGVQWESPNCRSAPNITSFEGNTAIPPTSNTNATTSAPASRMVPSASTSTGVPAHPGKKKRALTNPNNHFKPSSDSTTARNLCGIEWQDEHKTGTIAEFAAYWNSLTAQQKESYASRSKLVDAAKANVVEFMTNLNNPSA